MNKPALYMRFNYQALKDFSCFSRKYLKKLNFKENCNVLDIGCGPGDITRYALLPHLPKSTKKLVGVDISSEMIEFARMNHQNDERILYQELDITANNLPPHFHGSFDYIFSFYCLHFINNMRKGMENIHAMLQLKGELLFNLVLKADVFDIYDCLAKKDKWKLYMSDYNNILNYCNNLEDYFRTVLEEVGFKINAFEEERKMMIYAKHNFLGTMKAINLFDIPKHLEDEFVLDHFEVMKNAGKVFINDYCEEEISVVYTLVTVHATKL